MPRNGSGTFTLVTGNPVVSGAIIESDWANNTLADIADSITNSLARNGEGGMTAPLRLLDGVVATPSLAFVNETGSGLYRAAAGDIGLSVLGSRILRVRSTGLDVTGALSYDGTFTGGTGVVNLGSGQVYKDAAGNLGVGTTSPQARLSVSSSGAAGFEFFPTYPGGGVGTYIQSYDRSGAAYVNTAYSALSHSFRISNTERMVLDSSGNFGVGVSPAGRVDAVANAYSAFVARSGSAGANVDVVALRAVDSLAAAFANAAYQARSHVWGYNGSTLGMVLDSSGNVGINGAPDADAKFQVVGSVRASGGSPAAFNTTNGFTFQNSKDAGMCSPANGVVVLFTSGVETARIQSGSLGVGSTAPTAKLHVLRSGATDYTNAQIQIQGDTGNVLLGFHAGGSSTAMLRHARGGSGLDVTDGVQSAYAPIAASAFNVNSDYRVKENVVPLTGAVERLMQLKPSRFSFTKGSMMWSNGRTVDGFIAHEVASVVPEAVTGEKDAVTDEGSLVLQQMDQTKLVPLLVAAVQELNAKVEALAVA